MLTIISAKSLHEIKTDPNLILLDVSPATTISDIEIQHPNLQIKGAIKIDIKATFSDSNNDIPNMLLSPKLFTQECQKIGINKNSKIVVYDNIGNYMSPRAWWIFKIMGHQDIRVLDGGLNAWIRNKFDTETSRDRKLKEGNFITTLNRDMLKDKLDIEKAIHDQTSLIIDARSAERFAGAVPEPRANLQSGHIPNSVNLPYKTLLNKNGTYKSSRALKSIFKTLDIDSKQLIFTCGSGVTACILLLASEIISDNQKSLYDGSWSEWGRSKRSLQL